MEREIIGCVHMNKVL